MVEVGVEESRGVERRGRYHCSGKAGQRRGDAQGGGRCVGSARAPDLLLLLLSLLLSLLLLLSGAGGCGAT